MEEEEAITTQEDNQSYDLSPMTGADRPVEEDDNEATSAFIEKLNTGGSQLGLPAGAKSKINDYLVELRNKYADAAQNASRIRPSSPDYQEYVNTMNQVNRSIQNLAGQVDAFNANQITYIKDFDSNSLSKVDEIEGKAGVVSKLYRGDLDLKIGEDGSLMFGNNNTYAPFSSIASHTVKDFATADKLLKLTNEMYKTKEPMSSERQSLVLSQVKGMIKQGGRSAIISLINDGLIPGFENVNISKEMYATKNYPQLEKFFLETITKGIAAAANAGYKDKIAEEELKFGRTLAHDEIKFGRTLAHDETKFGINQKRDLIRKKQNYEWDLAHPKPTSNKKGKTGGSKGTKTQEEIKAELAEEKKRLNLLKGK
jgi:hypothetical protein